MDPGSRNPIQTDGHRRNVYAGTLAEAGRPRFGSMVEKLQVLVDGGKATPGPPLGPALGPLGVNIVESLKAINEKTKSFEGMKVPVTLLVDPKTKGFSIEVGTPPTSALIVKELKVVGTCVSMGVTVEGKPAKEFTKEIKAGKYDKQLAG